MKSVAEKIRRRRFYPVVIDGETIHLRALLNSELTTVQTFRTEDESVGYAIGCSLLNEDQTPVFVPTPDESAKQFGGRVLVELDLPTDTRAELVEKILKLSNGPASQDALEKN